MITLFRKYKMFTIKIDKDLNNTTYTAIDNSNEEIIKNSSYKNLLKQLRFFRFLKLI